MQNEEKIKNNLSAQEEFKTLKEKYSRLKSKFLQIDSKLKLLSSENDKLLEEKNQLQAKNHSYIQDATKLHQLSEEMKEFEGKVYSKRISQLEKQINSLENENKSLKLLKTIKFEGKNDFGNGEVFKVEQLISENHGLVVSMQNIIDSCSGFKMLDLGEEDRNKDNIKGYFVNFYVL